MSSNPNKLSQFWQELKRRKVVRVVTVYAGAAFVILELVDIIAEPLKLPSWLLSVVIVLLAIGFIIAVMLAWIYDIHPEGGMVKTEPADQLKVKDVPKSSYRWKIATYVSMVVIVAMILIAVFKPFSGPGSSMELSIMILPFRNDSPREGDDYIVNGLMEEILNKLTLIEELDVKSRTTSEKYRDSPKSSKEIASEVGVRYILAGSAQTVVDLTRIRLQLIEAHQDRHLWAKPYEREIRLENLFDIQEELSQSVADELEIVLDLEEKELIEKKPTENLDAYEAYLQANDLISEADYLTGVEQGIKLNDAKILLGRAVEMDSSFTEAYTSLGSIYIDNLFRWYTLNPEIAYSILDSGLVYVDKAMQCNPENRTALRLKGSYYQRIGDLEKAEKYIEASFKDRTKSYVDYEWEVLSYLEYNNFYPGIKSYLKYLELKPPNVDVPLYLLHEVFEAFLGTGFFDLAQQHAEQYLALTQDYNSYYYRMSYLQRWMGNHHAAQEYTYKWGELDSTSTAYLQWSMVNYTYLNEWDSAYKYMQLHEAEIKKQGLDIQPSLFYGMIYLKRGQKAEADYHLQGYLAELKKMIEWKTPDSQKGYIHLVLSAVYCELADGPNALKHLEYLMEVSAMDIGWIHTLKYHSSFDFVRNTPEFQSVLNHMEKAYRKEHSRIARLLKQQGYTSSQETN